MVIYDNHSKNNKNYHTNKFFYDKTTSEWLELENKYNYHTNKFFYDIVELLKEIKHTYATILTSSFMTQAKHGLLLV